MNTTKLIQLIVACTAATAVGVAAWWIVVHKSGSAKADKPAPPADVKKIVPEVELNLITCSEKAEERIGLKVGTVETKSVRRVRTYGGEAMIPIGRTILVAAPLGGTLKAPTGGVPKAGHPVKLGQPVFQLVPILTPDGKATLSASLADADGQVNNAKAQLELAKIALDRAKRVLAQGAGAQRQVDEAQAGYDVASKTLDAASTRKGILDKVVGTSDSGTATPIPIEAPEKGILRTVSALPDQTVPSGAALFEVVDLSTIWVRVPLPVGDYQQINRTDAARVGHLAPLPDEKPVEAKPVIAPPSANPLAATVDLYYEMPNPESEWIPGQRLGVSIPLNDNKESITVPWSAVVFDVHGGSWIFENVGPRKYARKRVEVAYSHGTDAVLSSGPASGTKVVIAGVQQLFGAETGFNK